MSATEAPAKLNLALVVGPLRDDGRHEIVSLMAPLELADRIELDSAEELHVSGFDDDTLVRGALEALATAAGTEPGWRVTIEKQIPVAAGLGGGSSDAAAALQLANETLDEPLPGARLHELAAALGADIPFFLAPGPKLARGDGTVLETLEVPADFMVVLLLPHGAEKSSTTAVYHEFDARRGDRGFGARVAALEHALRGGELADLPPNDLASSPHAAKLEELGAFRADVTGAGPAVYGLFRDGDAAAQAAGAVARLGRVWVDKPGW
jgi:4-diphosphocytidyl-2-C-methyl-D-erythritol kinase